MGELRAATFLIPTGHSFRTHTRSHNTHTHTRTHTYKLATIFLAGYRLPRFNVHEPLRANVGVCRVEHLCGEDLFGANGLLGRIFNFNCIKGSRHKLKVTSMAKNLSLETRKLQDDNRNCLSDNTKLNTNKITSQELGYTSASPESLALF